MDLFPYEHILFVKRKLHFCGTASSRKAARRSQKLFFVEGGVHREWCVHTTVLQPYFNGSNTCLSMEIYSRLGSTSLWVLIMVPGQEA